MDKIDLNKRAQIKPYTKMEFTEAKNKILKLHIELSEVETEINELNKIYREHLKKVNLCVLRKKQLSQEIKKLEDIIESVNIFDSVRVLDGFDTLIQEELTIISQGMDKTDYRKHGNYPRWYDLERLVKEIIEFKKLYPGWILERLSRGGQYDTLPPQTFYRFTYKTPQGHFMTIGGIECV